LRTFREAVQSNDFSISAELTLRQEYTAADVYRQADALAGLVDGVQVTDNSWSWVQMSPLAAASLLMQRDIDPIPLLTCRDRNRIALQSDLAGLRAMGVTSLLLTRGHRVPKDHHLQAATVFDTTGRELVAMAHAMDDDPSIGPEQQFFIGTGARVFLPGINWRAESLRARADAGAQFLQTQLCFNIDTIKAYVEALVRAKLTWNYSVIVSLAALPSAKTARWLKDNLTDSRIPDWVIEKLEAAPDPEREGIRICAELIQEISAIAGVSGVNLMAMGDAKAIPAAIRASALRS